jgi:hypothetical protein
MKSTRGDHFLIDFRVVVWVLFVMFITSYLSGRSWEQVVFVAYRSSRCLTLMHIAAIAMCVKTRIL